MTAKDLLHHVFPWEVTTGVERVDDVDAEATDADTTEAA
jgi:hypothetical protein